MKLLMLFGIGLVLIFSCTRLSPVEEDLRDTLDQTLHLEIFETVQQGNNLISFQEFRQQFKYISVVYLQNSCQPCYPKFIEWHHKMDSISTPDDYTVLFIIRGENFGDFMAKVLDLEFIESPYHVIMDNDYKYLDNNKDIPKWIIDSSLLIDAGNKIKLIGAPYTTPQMTDLFYEVCGLRSDQNAQQYQLKTMPSDFDWWLKKQFR